MLCPLMLARVIEWHNIAGKGIACLNANSLDIVAALTGKCKIIEVVVSA
jgi:hypothetical protein